MGNSVIGFLALIVFGFAVFGVIIIDSNLRKKKSTEPK